VARVLWINRALSRQIPFCLHAACLINSGNYNRLAYGNCASINIMFFNWCAGDRMKKYFNEFDLGSFWKDSEYARKQYVEEKPSEEPVNEIETELGYKLPGSYIELMKSQNGGIPVNTCFPTKERTSWAEDHVAISGILGIGRTKHIHCAAN
jgi:hypothetical protein